MSANTTLQTIKDSIPLAKKFLDFVNASRSPWHAVDTVRKQLVSNGYKQLHEKDNWKGSVNPNGKYFFTRNESTIVAFAVGNKFVSGNGFKWIGAHTDSPDLKIKPVSAQDKAGFLQVGVQCYGGGLWHTWFDRDLTVAGRCIVFNATNNKFEHRLVQLTKPILRIPSLAIHLNREVNEKGFLFNTETNVLPIIATAVKDQLSASKDDALLSGIEKNHHPLLLDLLATELKCKVADIKDLELSIVDTQPAQLGGIHEEFIFSPRLDNLMSCFCALEALINADKSLNADEDVRIVALFDHEEIGSSSSQGAASNLINDIFNRLNAVLASETTPVDATQTCIQKSFLISADMAHAVHPNYSEKHQEKHRPMIHKGPVIKVNTNQRYATNAVTSFITKELCAKAKVPYQEFVVRNDVGCGSTIGPILAAKSGIRVVDLGIPQLSMHSIREMCGTVDVTHAVQLFTTFFEEFRSVDNNISLD